MLATQTRRHSPAGRCERAFLFAAEGEAYGEGPSRAILPGGHLLGLRWLGSGSLALAGRALWHVLDGSTTLQRGALGRARLSLFLG